MVLGLWLRNLRRLRTPVQRSHALLHSQEQILAHKYKQVICSFYAKHPTKSFVNILPAVEITFDTFKDAKTFDIIGRVIDFICH